MRDHWKRGVIRPAPRNVVRERGKELAFVTDNGQTLILDAYNVRVIQIATRSDAAFSAWLNEVYSFMS